MYVNKVETPLVLHLIFSEVFLDDNVMMMHEMDTEDTEDMYADLEFDLLIMRSEQEQSAIRSKKAQLEEEMMGNKINRIQIQRDMVKADREKNEFLRYRNELNHQLTENNAISIQLRKEVFGEGSLEETAVKNEIYISRLQTDMILVLDQLQPRLRKLLPGTSRPCKKQMASVSTQTVLDPNEWESLQT